MNFILDMLKGAVIGIANVIPGVSGGTMAVSMGIYNKLISSVSHLFSQFKKSIRTLLPILIGCVIGIVCFTYAIKYLLTNQPLPTCLTFLGLILGGVPVLIREMKTGIRKSRRRRLTAMNVLAFLVMFLLAAALPFFKESTDTLTTLTATPEP